jgi:hypothetical protein
MFVLKKERCHRCGGVRIIRSENGKLIVECRSCGTRQPAKSEVTGHPLLPIKS